MLWFCFHHQSMKQKRRKPLIQFRREELTGSWFTWAGRWNGAEKSQLEIAVCLGRRRRSSCGTGRRSSSRWDDAKKRNKIERGFLGIKLEEAESVWEKLLLPSFYKTDFSAF
ncbi:unnamed protein product [Cuscuta epithymum]|uniref:Uncharacterized protein n=1 Tax=Cuscuta epithymum TaxID=186058 RepID=A0AAV0BZV7_9ASTE|nr:unnamed protein product [Cuscuta epithymum]